MNKQGVKNYIGIVIGLILSFNVGLYAWSGIQAQDGDKLSLAKWNEMTSGVWGRFGAAMHYTGGNVGIGTSAPSTILHINKNIIGKTTSVADSHIYVRGSDNGYGVAYGVLNSPAGGFIQTKLNDVSNVALPLFINPDGGNVGIGTNSPTQKLDVNGNIRAYDSIIGVYLAPGNGILIDYTNIATTWARGIFAYRGGYTGGAGFLGNTTLDSFHVGFGQNWRASNDSKFTVLSSGNIGIGTTVPSSKLEVNGWITTTNGGTSLFGNVTGNFGGKQAVLSVNKAAGGPNDEVWIGVNGGTSTGHIQLVASDIVLNAGGTGFMQLINGNLGIGVSNPTKKLQVAGEALATAWTTPSDQRYKKDIVNISNSLNKLQNINGVYYKRKDETKSKQTQIGFIAQNLEKEFPELVSTDTNGYKSVNYSNMSAVLVEAVKELKKENEDLKNRIIKLENLK